MDTSQLNRAAIVLLLLASLLVAGIPATAVSAQSANETVNNSTAPADNGTDSLTLEELRNGGQMPDGRAPSTRWLSDNANVWIDYPHTNPLRRQDANEWQAQQILESGQKVRTDELRFHYTGARDSSGEQLELKIAYWEVGEEQIQTANGTATRSVATNVSTQTKTLTFEGNSDTETVDLRSHLDGPVRVTMWVEGENSQTARWRFTHHTLQTEQAVSMSTVGDRLWWLISNYLIWVVGLGFIMVGATYWAKKRAGAGPMKGSLWWILAMMFVGGGALIFSYESLAEIFVDGPQLLALATVGLLSIPILEASTDAHKWLWLRPQLVESVSPSGGQALDAIKFEERSERVVEMADGRLAVVTPGVGKFLARVFGGVCYLEGIEDLPTESKATGKTKYKQIAWTKASAAETLELKPESWRFELPDTMREIIPFGVGAIALATVGHAVLGTTWVGVLALPLLALRPESGYARFEPANAQQRAAYVTALYAGIEHEEAEALEESREKRLRAEAQNQKQVEEALEQNDATLLEEAVTRDVDDVLDVDTALRELETEEDVDGAKTNGESEEKEIDVLEAMTKRLGRDDDE